MNRNFFDSHLADILKVVNLLLIIFSIDDIQAQSGWYQINAGTSQNLYDCQFVNSNTGYIVGGSSGIILKTTNGGTNWQNILMINYGLRGIFFIDVLTGWASPYGGPIKKTTNGGINWFDQTNPLSNSYILRRIDFVNPNTGWVAGGHESAYIGVVIYTSNGGNNWSIRLQAIKDMFYDLHFFDANTGFVLSTGIGVDVLLRTTNAGLSWSSIYAPGAQGYGINFLDQSTGLTCGFTHVAKTTNGGANWNAINISGALNLNSIVCIDSNNYTAAGDSGQIFRTTDGGMNWVLQATNVNVSLRKVTFINLQTGWAVGDNGTVLRTTTGGITFLEPVSNEIPKQFSLFQNFPNPFNPSTKINFALPKSEFTKLIIYDVLGREVATLANENLKAGSYSVDWNTFDFPSGVYYYKLTAGSFVDSKKMVLIK